jgi:hypothetical protein
VITVEPAAAAVAKQAWPWTATLALFYNIPLDKWVMIATLVYTILQIAMSVRKWIKEK